MNELPQIQIPAAKGLATYPAEGSHDAPRVLRNAVLRPGAWGCAPQARERLPGVQAAVYAGSESNLFVQLGMGVAYYRGEDGTASLVLAQGTLTRPVPFAPDLVVDGSDYLRPTGRTPQLAPAVIVERPGPDPNATGPYYYREYSSAPLPVDPDDPIGPPQPAPNNFLYPFDPALTYTVMVVPARGPDAPAPSPYTAPTILTLSPATVPEDKRGGGFRFRIHLMNLRGEANLYMDAEHTGAKLPRPVFFGRTIAGSAILDRIPNAFPPYPTSIHRFEPRLAEYHQGRIWTVGGAWFFQTFDNFGNQVLTDSPKRLWYSDVLLSAATTAPFFAEDYYMDMPFKASSRITALQSVGRYLYVFGDREVLILTGYNDETWTVESIGDSIGAVVPGSVQRLQQSVIYLSDSGALLLTAGQATDIGGDVRDLLLSLNRETITSTVDFAQEQYLISDGVTTLVYHLREQGWTQRDPDGAGQRLVYGGGTPYSLHGGALHTLDSPELLPLTVTLGAFGDPARRATWKALSAALDTDAPGCTLSATLRGRDMDALGELRDTVTDPATRTSGAGLTPVLSSVSVDGVGLSTALLTLTLTLTPAEGARRCLLRPPLTVQGSARSEAWA